MGQFWWQVTPYPIGTTNSGLLPHFVPVSGLLYIGNSLLQAMHVVVHVMILDRFDYDKSVFSVSEIAAFV